MEYLLNRFKEPTTWQGIIAIATTLGVTVSSEFQEAIVTLGVSIFAAVSVFMKERGANDVKND